MATAERKVLVHLLAVKPQTYETCRKLLHFNCRDLLDKVAKKNDANEWVLLDRQYRELDVWNFNFQKDEERQTAIEGAIRAYDRMRLSKEDKLWQMLLPQEERGKGMILSRLNIKNTTDAAATTPSTKATTFNKKTGLPKKTVEKKKPADKDASKAKKGKNSEAEPAKTAITPKPRVTKDAAAKERLATKRKERASKDDSDRTPAPKKTKPSTAAKSLLNKPKNPSPLSASPPVNASDFEDGHPVHKALSAAVSPKKAAKRKAEDMNGDSSHRSVQQTNGVNNKRRHLDTSSSSSNSPSSQHIKTNGLHTNGYSHPPPKHQHSGHHSPETSDSSTERSPPMKLSWKQSLDLAKRFKTYYDKYKRLHEELASSDVAPSEGKRKELINMRERLERMKSQVREGVL
jgi:RNA polymerase II elongation factor ELL